MSINYDELKNIAHSRIRELLPQWLPGGVVKGNEYVCADITGGSGTSFSVNLTHGMWADFAGTIKGGDLISLYGQIHGLKNGESAKQLLKQFGRLPVPKPIRAPSIVNLIKPPPETPTPPMEHKTYGAPTTFWTYKDSENNPIFYIARYDYKDADGKQLKSFAPFSYTEYGQWTKRAWPSPRPLYGLEQLKNIQWRIMIVEGEKSCEAARTLVKNNYQVLTWSGGAQAINKTDWSPLFGAENIIIWPDADAPGRKAASDIAGHLIKNSPQTKIKVINSPGESGFDAADAIESGWNFKETMDWAKPLVVEIKPVMKAEVLPALSPTPEITVNVNSNDPQVSDETHYLWESLGVVLGGGKKPYILSNIDNAGRILWKYKPWQGMVKFDEFSGSVFCDFNQTTWKRTGKYTKLTDAQTLAITMYMQRKIGFHKVSKQTVSDAIYGEADRNTFNAPKDWISSLTWDGKPRVESWLKTYLNCENDDAYLKAAGQNFWISLIARVFEPGCKVDNMLVLEGPQGNMKSSTIMAIGGDWYLQMIEKVGTKDFYQALRGKLIVEIAELDSFSRADDSTIKAMMTGVNDNYRKSYGKENQDFLRSCLFIGSTNDHEYLKDPTGARRYWPVKTTTINLSAIKRDRDQLFAEALVLYKSGSKWYEMPSDATLFEQEARRVHDAWEDSIATYLLGKSEVKVIEIATECLKMLPSQVHRHEQRRITGVLKVLGWSNKPKKIDGVVDRKWRKEKQVIKGQMSLNSIPNFAPKSNVNSNGNGHHISTDSEPEIDAINDECKTITDSETDSNDAYESDIIF